VKGRWRRWAFLTGALAAVALLVAGALPASARPWVARLAAEDRAAEDGGVARLVVVGAPGLAWSDLDRPDLPALEAVAAEGALGSLTVRAVRTRACAVDGWLTLSAGRRAADRAGPCREPLPVSGGRVPRWGEYLAAAASDSYDARPGTLTDAVATAGGCVETVGAGAAIGGSDGSGRVSVHHESVPSSFSCPVVLVDGGVLPGAGAERRTAVESLDALLADLLVAAPGADIVVAGVGDGNSPVRPRALVATGPSFPAGVLGSASTRQPGVTQLQDLTATVLERLGVGSEALTGRPLTVVASDEAASARVGERVAFETRAATMRAVSPQVTAWLATAYAVWAVAVAMLWWRRRAGTELPRWLVVTGVAVAASPVSSFVVNLVPWWRAPAPALVFLAGLAVVVAVLTGLAVRVGARRRIGGLRLVALVTLVVLAADVLSGSALQLGSVFGQNPVVGGRFYGLGNTSFALYGLAVLVVVGWLAASGPSRRASGGLALVILVAALGIEALPTLGADLGGPPGLLLGGLVVIAAAADVRLTVRRAIAAVLAAVVLGVLVAWLDWLRPAGARTHLGEFVETVLTGDAGAVVARKLAQNLANLGSPPLLAISAATVVLGVVAARTGWRPVPEGAVVLRGAIVLAVVGFVANDSGLVIPAFVALVLAPLLVAAGPAPSPSVGAGSSQSPSVGAGSSPWPSVVAEPSRSPSVGAGSSPL
jgi:hypothetical protein